MTAKSVAQNFKYYSSNDPRTNLRLRVCFKAAQEASHFGAEDGVDRVSISELSKQWLQAMRPPEAARWIKSPHEFPLLALTKL